MLACYAEAGYRCCSLPSLILGPGLKYLTGISGALVFIFLRFYRFDLFFTWPSIECPCNLQAFCVCKNIVKVTLHGEDKTSGIAKSEQKEEGPSSNQCHYCISL